MEVWTCGISLCDVAFMQEIESKLRTNMDAIQYVCHVVSFATIISAVLCMHVCTYKNSYDV